MERFEKIKAEFEELSDSDLMQVNGGKTLNGCLDELRVWSKKHPDASASELYDQFKIICELNYDDFDDEEIVRAKVLFEAMERTIEKGW